MTINEIDSTHCVSDLRIFIISTRVGPLIQYVSTTFEVASHKSSALTVLETNIISLFVVETYTIWYQHKFFIINAVGVYCLSTALIIVGRCVERNFIKSNDQRW